MKFGVMASLGGIIKKERGINMKGYTRKGNPCMRHYQGLKFIKKYAKEGNIRNAIFQAGAIYTRIIDDVILTEKERSKLLNRYYIIEKIYNLR